MSFTKLGRYDIRGELGRGAMGTVFRAHDPLIDREVAIKTLHPNLPEEVVADVRARFLREAKSAGRLNHPNIVTIFDVGEQDGVAYMAMELLEGRSLQDMMRETRRLPFADIAELAAQIGDALDRAQELGIVHRDVKPANIVVSPTGHAKLTDFGVAYVPSSTMTQTGTMIGSPRYMSPEQVLGLPIDPRSDIFSLGVVLYEMLAGRAPFVRADDSTIFPLINRIAAEPHPRVTQNDPTIPAAFEPILDRALAKKPEQRYQRGGELARDLRNLGGLATTGPAAVAPFDPDKTVERRPDALTNEQRLEKTTVTLPPTALTPPSPPIPAAPAEKKSGFVLELDSFERNFEADAEARLRAEEAARQQKAAELKRWAEAEKRKREAFDLSVEEQKGGAVDGAAPAGPGARRGALDLLKKRSAERTPEEDPAVIKAKADVELDQRMRATLAYLAEFVRELNAVSPAAERPYDYIYIGRLADVRLSRAFVDMRNCKIDGKDFGNHVFLTFRVQPAVPAAATVIGADIARCHDFLKRQNIAFESKTVAKSDFGQATREVFMVGAPLPCEVNIRADYDKREIEIELVNVRRPGRVQCRIAPAALEAAVDDLARYMLGADDDFDKTLARR